MNARLDRILNKLAQQHAFALLASLPVGADRLYALADGLADYGVLVLMAQVEDQDYERRVEHWVSGYVGLYRLLAETLFPSHRYVQALYADLERPPVIVLQGDSLPVIRIMASVVVPYASLRQRNYAATDAELRSVMTYLLTELDALSLPQQQIDRLYGDGIAWLRYILSAPVEQFAVNRARQALLDLLRAASPSVAQPEQVPADSRPSITATQEMFSTSVPLPFDILPPPPPERPK
jgi:hypothetical protein